MALISLNSTVCAICGAPLRDGDDIFATSGGPIQVEDPLWKYQDAAMHRACFATWPLRDEFRGKFNVHYDRHLRGMRFMREDGIVEERDARSQNAV